MATNFSDLQIATIINGMVEDYKRRFPNEVRTAEDINKGFCFYFAMQLRDRLGGDCIIVDTEGMNSHSFVFTNGLYYDSEAPNGVEDYYDLPYFRIHHEAENIPIVYVPDPLSPPEKSWRRYSESNGAAFENGWVKEEELLNTTVRAKELSSVD